MGSRKIQKITPFVINERKVKGGIYDRINTEFTGGVEIGSYHLDNYAGLDTAVLQSPITDMWVGGHTHRHIPLNTGNDNASNRPEAWHIEFDNTINPIDPTITFHSYDYLGSPPAVLIREEYAKRPINIKNIRQNSLGNFKHNYEVVQTSGRRITNNLIVDGFVAGGALTTQFITGSHNYSLPVLNSESGSKSVIVERFNAPGSKEESSRGALDREGEEMSPNISLPWRNYKIRQPFYSQLSQSTPQFGTSIHGVHRNTLPASGSRNEETDNGFISRPIPRTDIQYSWITASSTTTAGELGGYQAIAFGESDIEFISGSEIVVDNTKYIIDNLGISSLIKDKKQVDLNTKTISYSSDIGLSASFGELTHSPYSFTTWNSIRTGEHPISKALRKNNIISVQARLKPEEIKTAKLPYDGVEYNRFRKTKRSATSLNFSEPAVTFKYKPLKTKVRLVGAPEGSEQVIVHTFTNNIGNFANEDLRIETGLEEKERSEQFYDFLRSTYNDAGATGNPIAEFLGYQYSEVVWPREENTGLAKTRKREAYILDQPGFDRDGYDRQLGTQRVFWRDNQEDRKRSKNSEGGYYSSMNYLSTEETGSNFVQLESGSLSDFKITTVSSSYIKNSNIDDGIFNSISLLENVYSENEIFSYKALSFFTNYENSYLREKILNTVNQRSYAFSSSGEFNNLFNDFYEQIITDEISIKQSFGTLYRNTAYKNMLISLPEEYADYKDLSFKNSSDGCFANPKLKYVSFIGGAEINTGSYFQDDSKFTNELKLFLNSLNDIVYDVKLSGSDIYVAGEFLNTRGITGANHIAKWNGTSWSGLLDSGKSIGDTSIAIQYAATIEVSGNDIYVGGKFSNAGNTSAQGIARWDGTNWYELTGSTGYGLQGNKQVSKILLSGSNLYVAGKFQDAGNDPNADNIAYWDGTDWNAVSSGLESATEIKDIKFYGNNIYLAGTIQIAGTKHGIVEWDGSSWNILTSSYPFGGLEISGSDLYAIKASGLVGGPAGIFKYDLVSTGWTTVKSFSGVGYGGFTYAPNGALYYDQVEDEMYAIGTFQDSSTGYVYGLSRITGSNLEDIITPSGTKIQYAVSMIRSGSDFYVGGNFLNEDNQANADYFVKLSTYDNNSITAIKENTPIYQFDENLFSETIYSSENYFSTIDNGLIRKTEELSNKKPFFDSYENFIEDVAFKAKEYSTIPEFRINNNLEFYIKNNNFRKQDNNFLELDGQNEYSLHQNGSYNNLFIKNYLTSDLIEKFKEIKIQNEEISSIEKITLKIDGIKKLLPYNGFYPQDRTIQISNLLSNYIDENVRGGIYNAYYVNDYSKKSLNFDPIAGSITSLPTNIEVVNFDSKYYMFFGLKNESTDGNIKIYKTNTNDPEDWDTSLHHTIEPPTSWNTNADFGKRVKVISASNGINVFFATNNTSSINGNGYIGHVTSSDGNSWSQISFLNVEGTTDYVSGSGTSFADDFDVLLDNNKIILLIGESGKDTNTGYAYIVTGSLIQNEWKWTDKQTIFAGTDTENRAGYSVSLLSCSSGYQAYSSEPYGDYLGTNYGSILVSTSSTGLTWSTPVAVVRGFNTPPGNPSSAQEYGQIGVDGIKAVSYKNKSYLFFAYSTFDEPTGGRDAGVTCVVSSSLNNDWGSSNINSEATELYTRKYPGDFSLSRSRAFNIQVHNFDDKRLTYGFLNTADTSTSVTDYFEFVIGYSNDGENWLANDDLSFFRFDFTGGRGLAMSEYYIGEGSYPIFYTTDFVAPQNVYSIKNNSYAEFKIKVSNTEKYYKQAALEPFMAPGILYNTIKSGIAVDWPCITGSNTSIIPYGNETLVNAYYPKSFEMSSFQGENFYQSAYGILRSNIDYRVPFENIIFPFSAFEEKEEITEDFSILTISSSIQDDSDISKAIEGTYVYGGYEPYISPVDFSDINNLGPKRFSMPFAYRKAGSQDSGLYTLAMSNFLAETVKFFLKDEKMTTFVSDPDYKWKEFNSNKTYYMDIVLEKTTDLVMMEAYHSDLHPTGSNGEKMNGRYFGYPINKTDKEIWGEEDFTAEEKKLIHNDPAYAPYTPPYFEGVARARIAFKPQVSGKYTLQEVFDNATVENIFVDIAKGATTGSDAYVNAMPINSSIDIFGAAQAVEVTIDETSGEQTVRELQDSQNWIISPRMETPVLDFSSQELTPYENNYSKTGGFGRGMWSGYGSIPINGKGIKVRLEDPFATRPGPNTGSLLNQVGLRPEEKNVGSIADSKLISEAVVVIPYLDQNTRSPEYSTARKNKTDFEFIKISKKLFNKQLSNYRKGKPAISPGDISSITLEEAIQDTSITEMIEKMEKYVMPPEMNFLEYSDIDPFVMYIFEFEHVLDQEDLKDIWQGLMPKISYTAEEDSVSISHDSAPYELFEGKEMPENLRWMVFKVKRKAEYNYFNVTATTKDDTRFNFNKIIGRKEGTDVYSYNWPYDFFSLVEFAKVELMLDYKKKEE